MSQPTIDPNSSLNGYINQWEQANQQYNLDYASLISMLAQMIAEAKSGNIQGAFQMAEMAIMPAAMQVQGDVMGQLGATMNISSALQQFITGTENDVNGGSGMTPAQAQQFVKLLQELYNKVNTTPPPPWMDKNTQANLIKALDSISYGFCDPDHPCFNPNQLDPKHVQDCINKWTSNPTAPWWNGKTGQQNFQNLQSGLTQCNNTVSAQSQGLQAQEQFAANTFNQYMNSCENIFQSTQQQDQAMVQNQKS